MKKLKLLIIFVPIFIINNIFPQEINFNDLSLGVVLQYSVPIGDFGKYWNNEPGAGIVLDYKLTKSISLEGLISASYFKPVENPNRFPKLIVLNMPAGLKYSFRLIQNLDANLTAGITNTSMAYKGGISENLENNDIESEFGVFFALGLNTKLNQLFNIEFFTQAQNIFTSPVSITLYNFGIKFLFN
jgi:hypothetical protein